MTDLRISRWTKLAALAFAFAGALAAQEDVEGGKDHPLVSRMPDSRITEYKHQFDAVEFTTAAGKKVALEGTVTNIVYFHNIPEKQPSPLQVLRNYQNAIKGIGGQVVYERRSDDGGETTLKIVRDGREFWISVQPGVFSAPTQSYRLVVLEREAMTQDVTAAQMLAALNKDGFIALYIEFDTGKWDIKPVAEPTVSQIVALCKQNPALKLAIEGHTDNVGTAAANKTLSESRARAVVNAIVAQGVAAGRLTAAGFGQDRPVADNRTEEGRAKNRRVELVKK